MKQKLPNGKVFIKANLSRNAPFWPKSHKPFLHTAQTAGSPGSYFLYYNFVLKDGHTYEYFYGTYNTFDMMLADWKNLNGLVPGTGLSPIKGCWFNFKVRATCFNKFQL